MSSPATDPCPAIWHDELDPTAPTVPCALEDEHGGPHQNRRAGITWGHAGDWYAA